MSDTNLIELLTDMTLLHINNHQRFQRATLAMVARHKPKNPKEISGPLQAVRNVWVWNVASDLELWFSSLSYDVRDKVDDMKTKLRKETIKYPQTRDNIDDLVLNVIGEHLTRSVALLDYRAIANRLIDTHIENDNYVANNA